MSHKYINFQHSMTQRRTALTQITSRLFAQLSHDLGTPVTALRGYIKMVLDGRAGTLTDAQREYLTIALENADQLRGLANRVGKIPDFIDQLHAEAFDIRGEWAEAVSVRRSTLMEKAITVTERSLADRLVVVGDRMQLRHAFERMMDVSIQSAQRGNQIFAEFSRGKDQDITVRICLSGDGIPATADLASVRNTILLHGGTLSLETQSGAGSTCIISLPEAGI